MEEEWRSPESKLLELQSGSTVFHQVKVQQEMLEPFRVPSAEQLHGDAGFIPAGPVPALTGG